MNELKESLTVLKYAIGEVKKEVGVVEGRVDKHNDEFDELRQQLH